jgi:hypothetical protein
MNMEKSQTYNEKDLEMAFMQGYDLGVGKVSEELLDAEWYGFKGRLMSLKATNHLGVETGGSQNDGK